MVAKQNTQIDVMPKIKTLDRGSARLIAAEFRKAFGPIAAQLGPLARAPRKRVAARHEGREVLRRHPSRREPMFQLQLVGDYRYGGVRIGDRKFSIVRNGDALERVSEVFDHQEARPIWDASMAMTQEVLDLLRAEVSDHGEASAGRQDVQVHGPAGANGSHVQALSRTPTSQERWKDRTMKIEIENTIENRVAEHVRKRLRAIKARLPQRRIGHFTHLRLNHDFASTIKDRSVAFTDLLLEAMARPSIANWDELRAFGILREAALHIRDVTVIEGNTTHVSREDGGMALIVELDDNTEEGMFVRLQSWSEKCDHAELERFINRRVRITVEVID